jgi:hypothetical protein
MPIKVLVVSSRGAAVVVNVRVKRPRWQNFLMY